MIFIIHPSIINKIKRKIIINNIYIRRFDIARIVIIFKIKDILNRAWFVKRTIKEDDNLYNYLNSSAFSPEDVAVVKDLDSQSFNKGEILNIEWGIHEMVIDVEASNKSFLVVKISIFLISILLFFMIAFNYLA